MARAESASHDNATTCLSRCPTHSALSLLRLFTRTRSQGPPQPARFRIRIGDKTHPSLTYTAASPQQPRKGRSCSNRQQSPVRICAVRSGGGRRFKVWRRRCRLPVVGNSQQKRSVPQASVRVSCTRLASAARAENLWKKKVAVAARRNCRRRGNMPAASPCHDHKHWTWICR